MKQIITCCIVLSRIDFREADRILTVLTPDHGKLSLIAKGVRKPRSKLAGGIELLSVSDVTILPGKGEISTLISSRLQKHYGKITTDIKRTMLAYELLKRINKATEDAADEEYFLLLEQTLASLNDLDITTDITELWFTMQLLSLMGYGPNLSSDTDGNKLEQEKNYRFDFDNSAFVAENDGPYGSRHIKHLRLCIAEKLKTSKIAKIKYIDDDIGKSLSLAKSILLNHVRV